jgi:hypothetical protein
MAFPVGTFKKSINTKQHYEVCADFKRSAHNFHPDQTRNESMDRNSLMTLSMLLL